MIHVKEHKETEKIREGRWRIKSVGKIVIKPNIREKTTSQAKEVHGEVEIKDIK